LDITGPVKLSDTSLVGFNLGSKMGALSAFAGHAVSNPDTSIRNFSLNAHMSAAGTQADGINLDVPAIGVITGAGTVSPSGALAFKMLANLSGGMVGGVSKVAAVGSGKGGIPFAIEGTTADPKFVPELGGVATSLATGAVKGAAGSVSSVAAAPTSGVTGLLGHKKKK
jgi:AsmA protein